jgi:hypothetical protein
MRESKYEREHGVRGEHTQKKTDQDEQKSSTLTENKAEKLPILARQT